MFTLEQLKTEHAKVKTGADFPRYVQAISRLGVISYSTYVHDGHTGFSGKENHLLQTEAKYSLMNVAEKGNAGNLQKQLKIHQQGQTDYLTFCKDAAAAGVEKWTVDISKMTCTYFDKSGNALLVEPIPGA